MKRPLLILAAAMCCFFVCACGISFQMAASPSSFESEQSSSRSNVAFADEGGEATASSVYLVAIPGMRWDDVNATDTPTLYTLVKNYASCNVITEADGNLSGYDQEGNYSYTQLSGMTLSEADDEVAAIFHEMGPDDSLIVTASPSFADPQYDMEGYAPTILVDAGNSGLLTSTTTTRSGLITSGDLDNAIAELLIAPQKNPGNTSVFLFSYLMNANDRVGQLTKDNALAIAVDESTPYFYTGFVIWMSLTLLFTIALGVFGKRLRKRASEFAITSTHLVWIVALSIPVSTYLMFVYVPTGVTPVGSLIYFAVWVVIVSFIAALIGVRRCWADSMIFILALTVVIIVGDRLLGGPLTQCGYLSYSPLGTTRYFGIGNEGASILFGAWIVLSMMIQCQHPHGRFTNLFKKWLFPLISAFIIAIIAAPWWGANFGVLIWGTVGVLVAWTLFNGRKITVRDVLLTILIAGLLTAAVLLLDTTFNGESHLGAQVSDVSGTWYLAIFQIVNDMLELSWRTVVFSPILTVVFFVIVGFLIWLRVTKHGPYSWLWSHDEVFKGAYTAMLISAGMQLLTEDSGIMMPSLLLLYLVAGLTWVVCEGMRQRIYADELDKAGNRRPLFQRARDRRRLRSR